MDLTSCTILKNRQDACSTKSAFSCGTGILPVHKQLIENGATSQVNRSQRAASIGFELNSGWAMFSVLVAQPTIHWCQRNVKRSTGLLFDD
ncbi:hypothetical protein QUB75_12410 [Microcoleus sp. K1-B6]|uniref:hypothetical protein n=1 Tax=Microcoleus sp. K1-B1 TaxID=2818782 RepID=UPI002FD3967C